VPMDAAAAFWAQPVMYLKKVGPKRAEALKKELDIETCGQLLDYTPEKYLDRTQRTMIADLQPNVQSVLIGRLGRFELQMGGKFKKRLRTSMYDGTGYVELMWFQGAQWMQEKYHEGQEVVAFGRAVRSRSGLTITHPELEILPHGDDGSVALRIQPFYSTTEGLKKAGLDSKGMRAVMEQLLLQGANYIQESLPQALLAEYQLMDRRSTFVQLHLPDSPEKLAQARRRMKFEELFMFELVLARRKAVNQPTHIAWPFATIGEKFNRFYKEQLPFELTNAQKRVIKEVRVDVAREQQMNRMVQGDVGSGKTMVALMACLMAVDNGFQAAVMAPTEILAEQHFKNFYRYLTQLDLQVDMLSGGLKTATKTRVLRDLKLGTSHIVIGTHALLEDTVQFQRLGLTVIDEQHKFGVRQRARLWTKGERYPHNLAMTATPIPRTLALTLYGDIDLSVIDELPPGRKPVKTVIRNDERRLEVYGFVKNQLQAGRQAYFIYPLVEESEKSDMLAVSAAYQDLTKVFSEFAVDLVHGAMRPEDKERTMNRFKRNQVQLLVATTVIEVGVDVPNASVMVIENSERFGLSQLHQLRGRVGRGGEQSFCILMLGKERANPNVKKRLDAMVETNDGFKIAEVDLQLRGPGDFLGTKQSGLPEFRFADVGQDAQLIELARKAAFAMIALDPEIEAPEHRQLRILFRNYCRNQQFEDLLA
jgi:ATP-dependent DNA helicase RecG